MFSYVNVLKRSLFAPSEPATQNPHPSPTEAMDLKTDWLLIHDEASSRTSELINLNDISQSEAPSEATLQNNETELMSEARRQELEEIARTRQAWIQKQRKSLASLGKSSSGSGVRRNKLKHMATNSKRNRNQNSESGSQSNTNSSDHGYDHHETNNLANNHKPTQLAIGGGSGRTSSSNNNTTRSPEGVRTRSKSALRKQFQVKFKPYGRKCNTLQQPAAKSMV